MADDHLNVLARFLTSEFASANEISDEWVASSIDGNFTEFENISTVIKPSFYDNNEFVDTLEQLAEKLRDFQLKCNDPKLWKELAEQKLAGKKLTVFLWYPVEWALAKDSGPEAVRAGVYAACSILLLTSIEGAQAFQIFNPFLYQKCLDLFRLLYRAITFDAKDITAKGKKGKGAAKKPPPPKAKGRAKGRGAAEESELNQSEADECRLDKGIARDCLELCTEAFYVFLQHVALSAFNDVAITTTDLIRDLARLDVNRDCRVTAARSLRDFQSIQKISERCFCLMHLLINDRHGFGGVLVYSRIIYPRFAFWSFDLEAIPSSSSIPATFTMWKDLFLNFIEERVRVNNKDELHVLFKVLEQLYHKCTDRQDYRTRVATTCVEVLHLLPPIYRYDFVQRVDCFSKNQKGSLRSFSIEVVPLLLKHIDFSGEDPFARPEADGNGQKNADETRNETRAANKTSVKPRKNRDGSDSEGSGNESEKENEADDGDGDQERAKEEKKKPEKRKGRALPALDRLDALPALYECIVRSCLDKSSGVRGRAIVHLSVLLEDERHSRAIIEQAQKMFDTAPKMFVGGESKARKEGENGNENDEEEEPQDDSLELDDSEINIDNLVLHIITGAVDDEKAGVRKSGIVALQSFYASCVSAEEADKCLTLLKKRCVDASLMVRKQAAESMNSLLMKSKDYRNELEESWLKSVLPMINDREQSVQNLASKLITEALLNPLQGATDEGTWSLLARIEQEDNHRRLMLRAMFYQSKEGQLSPNIVTVLLNKIDALPEKIDILWMLLSDFGVVFQNKIKPNRALDAWYRLEDGDESNKVRYIAKIVSQGTNLLNDEQRDQLSADLEEKLFEFRIDAPHISSVYLCLAKLMDAVGELSQGKAELERFGKRLLDHCKELIDEALKFVGAQEEEDHCAAREQRLIRVITTIGEVIQFSPILINQCSRLVDRLKTIIASEICQADPNFRANSAIPSLIPTPMNSRPVSRMNEPHTLPPSIGSQSQSQSQSQPGSSQSTQPTTLQNGFAFLAPGVRAYAVLAIGKFCLMDEKLAKASIPVFARQLKVNADHVIRNNIVLVVCDLCIRYTLLVDRYSPIIAACLRDRSTIVRHQTLESLTNLIKEQFIRWEGQIMYRFVSTILDENRAIREYAQFCLKDVLLLQFPTMFYHHFIECLLYFNDVKRSHMKSDDLEIASNLQLSFSGAENEETRMKLYKFMIDTFDDKQKFITNANICAQVLNPILRGEYPFKDVKVQSLLKDSFEIMSSKEIKLRLDVGTRDDEDGDEPPAAVVKEAKKCISEAFRKAFNENIMPPLLEMRTFLLEQRSPLVRYCFGVLRTICREYKDQIDEFVAGDEQLRDEIEYDIKRFERAEKAEREAKRRAAEQAKLDRRRSRRSLAAASMIHRAINTPGRPLREAARDGENAGGALPRVKEEIGEVVSEMERPVPMETNEAETAPVANVVVKDEPMEEEATAIEPTVSDPSAPVDSEENVPEGPEVTAMELDEPAAPLPETPKTQADLPKRRSTSRRSGGVNLEKSRQEDVGAQDMKSQSDGLMMAESGDDNDGKEAAALQGRPKRNTKAAKTSEKRNAKKTISDVEMESDSKEVDTENDSDTATNVRRRSARRSRDSVSSAQSATSSSAPSTSSLASPMPAKESAANKENKPATTRRWTSTAEDAKPSGNGGKTKGKTAVEVEPFVVPTAAARKRTRAPTPQRAASTPIKNMPADLTFTGVPGLPDLDLSAIAQDEANPNRKSTRQRRTAQRSTAAMESIREQE